MAPPSALHRAGRVLRPWLLACIAAAPASAFDLTSKHPEHGFSIGLPAAFEARPVPPGSEGLLLVHAPKDAPKDRRAPVTHQVFTVEDAATAEDVQRWVLRTFQPSELARERSVRRRYGRTPARFTGAYLDGAGETRALFVHGWIEDTRALIFVGECEPRIERRETRVFARVASSFRFFSQAEIDGERARWTRRYRRTRLPHVEERIEVACALVDGWSVRDTEHSIVLYHGPGSAPVLEQIAEELVAARRRFTSDFPPDRPAESLSVVRVCRDRGEYLTFGGNPGTVGHFNPNTRELVLYDAREVREGRLPAGHQTLCTLYHEACHQFVHHTASAVRPHAWYDEGTAEFYAGAVVDRGRVIRIEGLPERERFLRTRLASGSLPALETLLRMSQQEYYASPDVNYSMGYALVRFLRTSRAARAEEAWGGLLERYFAELRARWRLEAEGAAFSGMTGSRLRAAAGRARERALEAALEGVDVAELEEALRAWIRAGGS
ncbi:MAG: hypothetical protein VX015_10470 [Planctomycetota bacterium]|nr:hypothetical protein [Planctomycetota bacterium]